MNECLPSTAYWFAPVEKPSQQEIFIKSCVKLSAPSFPIPLFSFKESALMVLIRKPHIGSRERFTKNHIHSAIVRVLDTEIAPSPKSAANQKSAKSNVVLSVAVGSG